MRGPEFPENKGRSARRPHQGRRCDGKTPYATWSEGKEVAISKKFAA